jgi:hypothetical protein
MVWRRKSKASNTDVILQAQQLDGVSPQWGKNGFKPGQD